MFARLRTLLQIDFVFRCVCPESNFIVAVDLAKVLNQYPSDYIFIHHDTLARRQSSLIKSSCLFPTSLPSLIRPYAVLCIVENQAEKL